MRIATVLEMKGGRVITISPDASVVEALRLLDAHQIGALVVSEDGIHAVGVLSERDLVRGMHRLGCEVRDLRVEVLMTPLRQVTTEEGTVDDVLTQMTEARVRHVPVLSSGSLVGLVSIGDLVKVRMDELEAARR